MQKEIRFFRKDDKWYADIPNHTLEENEMVSGADVALEIISMYRNEVTLTISLEQNGPFIMHLKKEKEDPLGCTYKVVKSSFEFPWDPIWICSVTLDVFGAFPPNIYIIDIK